MPPLPTVLVSRLPFDGRIQDFDVVARDGRPLMVGSHGRSLQAFSWDVSGDAWTKHELADPWLGGDGYTELTALAAAVVDGRIVIGGGGQHQGFAQWDLESGAVRMSAEDGGVASATAAVLGGRTWFVVGVSSGPPVQLWDPSVADPAQDAPDDAPSPYDDLIEVNALESYSYASSAIAAGTLKDRPILVGPGGDARVFVWDVENDALHLEIDDVELDLHDFALVDAGAPRVVASGDRNLLVGDLATGEWESPITVPCAAVTCLDTTVADGGAIAVTGSEDGTICAWDLDARRLLAEPFHGEHAITALRITELDGRQVVISSDKDGAVRVLALTPQR
ncbi:WD40 repeat domain-containing protein [Actinomadura oligospora]|uniref:WD40 repeat domain-containing protein n=1 Tax=Actinomadura oligospora TaxID=111804 RepID=UPI00047DB481|nr:WD40 repeat domain-containing protein [Actinomadura oligospora]